MSLPSLCLHGCFARFFGRLHTHTFLSDMSKRLRICLETAGGETPWPFLPSPADGFVAFDMHSFKTFCRRWRWHLFAKHSCGRDNSSLTWAATVLHDIRLPPVLLYSLLAFLSFSRLPYPRPALPSSCLPSTCFCLPCVPHCHSCGGLFRGHVSPSCRAFKLREKHTYTTNTLDCWRAVVLPLRWCGLRCGVRAWRFCRLSAASAAGFVPYHNAVTPVPFSSLAWLSILYGSLPYMNRHVPIVLFFWRCAACCHFSFFCTRRSRLCTNSGCRIFAFCWNAWRYDTV